MPYCPQCMSEYIEGTRECEDCRVPLSPGSPPESAVRQAKDEDLADSKLVCVRRFSGGTAQLDADVARNLLQTQGIPCVLPGEISAELLPVLDVPVLVREEDAERATQLLKSYFDAQGPIPVE